MFNNAKYALGKRLSLMFGFGIASGFPLLLTGSTLQAWLTEKSIDLSTIGLFALVGLPYSLKFLWSFFLDRFTIAPLGKRRGWVFVAQICTALSIFLLAQTGHFLSIPLIFLTAFAVTFFSATLDIALDAMRRELFDDTDLGLATSFFVNGYRIGLLLSGAGILLFADRYPWRDVMVIAAGFMLATSFLTFLAEEPTSPRHRPSRKISHMFIEPLKDFFSKKNALWICLFILAYKLGDGLASSLTTPFFLQIGFTKTDIATFAKTLGLFSSIAGAFLAGGLMKHLSIYSALFIFGVFQMASTLVYAVLATVHHQTWMLGLGMFIEYFAAGMGSCALATYMGQKSARVYAASQFALLSSLMGIPRVIFAAPMGWVAQQTGWVWFFILCTLLGLPGLFLLKKLKI